MNRSVVLHTLSALGYAVPYAFLCLYGDAVQGSALPYLLSLLSVGILAAHTRRHRAAACAGCLLSFLSSCVCLFFFRSERFAWYFKPLTDFQLLTLLSLLMLALHLAAFRTGKDA